MSDEIFFDGARYISAGDAALSHDLSRDYVAKLCREHKVQGKRVGKNWYANELALKEYLVSQEYHRSRRRESLKGERAREYNQLNAFSEPSAGDVSEESVLSRMGAHVSRGRSRALEAVIGAKGIIPSAALPQSVKSLHGKLAATAAKHGQLLADATRGLASPSLSDAAARTFAHAPLYSVSPLGELLHKATALALAFMLTFGTYGLVDQDAARFAISSTRESVRSLVADYQEITGGGIGQLASNLESQVKVAVENPGISLAAAAGFFPERLANFAKAFNAGVDEAVYAVAFPNGLVERNLAGSTGGGQVAVEIQPYAAPASRDDTATYANATTPGGPTTVINQPVIERIVERVIPQKTVIEAGGLTDAYLETKLNQLENKLSAQMYAIGSANSTAIAGNYVVTAQTNRINELTRVEINDSTYTNGYITGSELRDVFITGSNISDSAISATELTVSGTSAFATTTFAGDISLDKALIFSSSSSTFTSTFASTTNLLSANATSTNFFATFAQLTTGIISSLSTTLADITGLTVTNSTTTNATTTNSYITNLVADTASTTNATSTNFFATTASSTNLFAQLATLGSTTVNSLSVGGGISSGGGLTVSGNTTLTNFTAVNGTTTNATSTNFFATNFVGTNATTTNLFTTRLSVDSLSLGSGITSHFVPSANDTYDIGSPSFYWRTGYIDTITTNSISAASTSIGGTNSETLTINADNATSDTEDMSLIFYRGAVVPNAVFSWNSAVGAKRFEFNQAAYISNLSGSTTQPTLRLQGVTGQIGNLFEIASSTGATMFSVDASGATLGNGFLSQASSTVVGDFTATGNTTFGGTFSVGTTTLTNLSVSNTSTSSFAGPVTFGPNYLNIISTGQVAIGAAIANASALLQLDSTSRGFLPPRLTTIQKNAISSPSSGLVLYDADLNKLNVYNGSAWKNVGSTEIGGEVTNGTQGSVLFIGDGTVLGQDNANFSYASSTQTLSLARLSLTAGTSTNFFATTASSTNLFAQSASLGALSAGSLALTSTSGTTTIASGQGFTIGGSQFVLQQGSGNVGVGTTSPASLFAINGVANFFSNATSTIYGALQTNNLIPGGSYTNNLAAFDLGATSQRWNALWAGTVNVGTSTFSLASNAASGLGFYNAASAGGTQVMTLSSSGNVGIGTTSPGYKLGVAGNVGIDGYLNFPSAGVQPGGMGIFNSAGTSFTFVGGSTGTYFNSNSNGATHLAILDGGNVGIGTSSPGSLLSLSGIANFTTATSTFYASGGINITSGCFALNGACINVSGGPLAVYATSSVGTTTVQFTGTANSAPSFSAGVLTLPNNASFIVVEVWGGGGGGFGGAGGTVGGNGGMTCISAGAVACASAMLSATGGAAAGVGGGAGGTGSGGDLNLTGGVGGGSVANNGSVVTYASGGEGGSAARGGGGGAPNGLGAGVAGQPFGGGGSGGGINNQVGVFNGGGGGGGGYSQKLVSSIAASYTFAVGAGGAAGPGGTVAGGAGGAGGISITIYTTGTGGAGGSGQSQSPTVTTLTSGSGTYTVPPGVSYLRVRMVGGGAGGSAGGGGGGVGAAGGNTTFGALTAGGAAAGPNNSAAGPGGTASGGDINIVGGSSAGTTYGYSAIGGSPAGSAGGSSVLGGAGGSSYNGAGGNAAANSGSGGGGGGINSQTNVAGSGGGSGGYVEKLYASPSASYSYAVGAGGSGNTSPGTGGYNGGNGAAGVIIIDEFYGSASSGVVGAGVDGQFAFYNATGATLSATSSIFVSTSTSMIGIGTTTPWARLSVTSPTQQSGSLSLFSIASTTGASLFTVLGNGGIGIGTTTNPFGGELSAGLTIANALVIASSTNLSTTTSALYNQNGTLYFNGTAVGTGAGGSGGGQLIATYATSSVGTTTVSFAGAAGSAPSFSAGALTLPSNTSYVVVEVWGAGGGGAGAPNGGNGGTGGMTCFGTNATACSSPTLSATGGGGGGSNGSGNAAAGTGSGGDVNLTGGAGGATVALTGSAALYHTGGAGGSAPLGGGGGRSTNGSGVAGSPFGGGGSGAALSANAGQYGAGGGSGGGYSSKLITSLAGSYTFAVGAGGTAGSSGGGAGGAGGVVISVYTSGISQGAIGAGAAGYLPYFTSDTASTSLSATSSIFLSSASYVGIGTTTPWARLSVTSPGQQSGSLSLFSIASTTGASLFTVLGNGSVGIGTSTPGSLLSIQGVANITTATSTFYGTGGLNIASGCFAIAGTCVTGSGSGSGGGQLLATYASSTVGTTTVSFAGAENSAPSFSNGTLTLPSNTGYVVVEVWGGGGGGGGGSAGGAVGSTGGTTCFGSNATACSSPLLSAAGGVGGAAGTGSQQNSPGGAGGSGSGGDVNLTGQAGNVGETAGGLGPAGGGGSAPRGGGGGAGGASQSNGSAGAAFGGGGGGGGADPGVNNAATGGGGGGYAQELISNPSGTYTYTVAAGGAGGVATRNGGAGGSGGIVISVYTTSNTEASGAVVLTGIRKIASTAVWSKPTNLSYAVVEIWGAGGGGADSTSGFGGSGGGYAKKRVTAADLAATSSIYAIIGAGGGSGAAGGFSAFGDIASSTGGGGGSGSAGTPGTGVNGDINLTGQAGSMAVAAATVGPGGNAPFMSGAGLAGNSGGTLNAAANSGGGGAGFTSPGPGTGGSGLIIVYEYSTTGLTVGSVGSGTEGQFAFYQATGQDLVATSTLFVSTTTSYLGIGTTTPWAKLSITSPGQQSGNLALFSVASTTGTSLFNIQGNGRIGIGTSSPQQALLSIANTGTATRIAIDTGGTDNAEMIRYTRNGITLWDTIVDGSGISDGYFLQDGDASNGVYLAQNSTSWTGYSDARLKEHVETYSVLDKLTDFRAVAFDWKANGVHDIGVIAQEVALLFPEVVEQGSDGDLATTTVNQEGVWGVRYDKFGALALQGLKELNLKVDVKTGELVTEIDALRAATSTAMDLVAASSTASTSTPWVGSFAEAGENIKAGITALTDTVIRVMGHAVFASTGIFEEIFAKKIHTDELCVSKSDGTEVCVTGDQLAAALAGLSSESGSDGAGGAGEEGEAPPEESEESPGEGEVAEDTTAPEVSVNGANPAEIEVGSVYSDLGVSATDNVSTNLSIKASVNGGEEIDVSQITIDTSIVGTHSIEYRVRDGAENTGTVTRTVNVAAIESPESPEPPAEEPETP